MPSWKNPLSGVWQDPNSWDVGVPNGPGAVANLTVSAPGSISINVVLLAGQIVTVGTMNIVADADDGWFINGGGGTPARLIFQGVNGSPAFLNADTNGSARMTGFIPPQLRTTLASDLILTTQDADTTFLFATDTDGNGDLYKFGAGTLKFAGNNSSWLGDAHLSGGRTEVVQDTSLNQANISLDNYAVLVAANFTLANRIEVGPGASGGTIAALSGASFILSGRLVVASALEVAVIFGTATDNGTIVLTGTSIVEDTGGFAIAAGTLRLGNAGVAANYFSSLAPQGLVQVVGQLDTNGFAAHIDNLDMDGGILLTSSGALNLIVDDETNGANTQEGSIWGTAGVDQILVNALTNFNLRGVNFTAWTDGTDSITINGGSLGNSLTGADQSDIINGNAGNDTLTGMGGADVLTGGTGNDTYRIGDALDMLVEKPGEGVDTIVILPGGPTTYTLPAEFENLTFENSAKNNGFGNAADNVLTGGLGDDVLNGLSGADIMQGLNGNDFYYVDNAADQVIEQVGGGGGTDRVFASVSYTLGANQAVEKLTTTNNDGTDAINLTGNERTDQIYGNAGNNILDGKGGADILVGLKGDDWYFVDNIGDQIQDLAGDGNDRVFASVSYTLAAGLSVEKLTTSNNFGTAAINLTGNELAQDIFGNDGTNILDGKGGADLLVGAKGDDFFYVDNAGDRIAELAGEGSDRVFVSTSYTLGAGQSVEKLTTSQNNGTATINLTGNELAQAIYGNAGNNILDGKAGADMLFGLGGADTFTFTTALGGGNADHLGDFLSATDKIALDDAVFTAIGPVGALDPNAFVIGSAAADASDRIIYNDTTGQLFYDADGTGAVAAVLFATLDTKPAIAATDFVVI